MSEDILKAIEQKKKELSLYGKQMEDQLIP
jgi:hypothetical protein